MKKVYTRPELFCEEYELSAAIAGNCSVGMGAYNVNSGDPYSCSYTMGPKKVFLTTGICNSVPETDGADGTFCYQPTPHLSYLVHNSKQETGSAFAAGFFCTNKIL